MNRSVPADLKNAGKMAQAIHEDRAEAARQAAASFARLMQQFDGIDAQIADICSKMKGETK